MPGALRCPVFVSGQSCGWSGCGSAVLAGSLCWLVSSAGWTAVQRAGLSVVLANQLRWVAALFSCGAWSAVLAGRLCWLVSCAGCCTLADLAEPQETFSLHTAHRKPDFG